MTIFARSYRSEAPPAPAGPTADAGVPKQSRVAMEASMESMTLVEATDYLDWLEAHGEAAREIVVMSDGRVVVR